ncbi:MAG: deoxyribodipyrimidine photo-lyase, partial [Gemmatimonadota bacterium]|nr:deoxyribodipyrimidine photo-lyase [Gemmatimonadota bacterium]
MRAALDRGAPVVPVYVWSPDDEGPWIPGAASRWWLHHSLQQLDAALRKAGSRLIVRRGPAATVLPELAAECGATAVTWARRYEPDARTATTAVRDALAARGVEAVETRGNLLFEPGEVLTKSGDPYQVFTPFWTALQAVPGGVAPSLRAPKSVPAPSRWPSSERIAALGLEPRVDWAGGLRDLWRPGEAGGRAALRRFASVRLARYPKARDVPAHTGPSPLAP